MLIRVLKEVRKTDRLSGTALLHQAYETSTGIHDYIAQEIQERMVGDPSLKRPLSTVALHYAEDYSTNSHLLNICTIFAESKVTLHYGYNLTEFLELPHELCTHILKDCHSRQKNENTVASNIINDLQNQPKK
jgi:hypothetical protein